MKILSHRGYWATAGEKNTEKAFRRSFVLGYGTETDIRDCRGELVISHDMASGSEIRCTEFLKLAHEGTVPTGNPLTLALNIKADGLAGELRRLLDSHSMLDCFVFDMSVPDMRSYFDVGIPVFTRMSEVEVHPVWIEQAAGVWLDGFESEWYDISTIEGLLRMGKRVCIVSSELHKRPCHALWERLKPLAGETSLMLCTDLPEDATRFFGNEPGDSK